MFTNKGELTQIQMDGSAPVRQCFFSLFSTMQSTFKPLSKRPRNAIKNDAKWPEKFYCGAKNTHFCFTAKQLISSQTPLTAIQSLDFKPQRVTGHHEKTGSGTSKSDYFMK
jgi:hypothetical protein